MEITQDEKINLIARSIAQGGWSSIRHLVSKLDEAEIDNYSYLWEEEDE
jgi:hypothetical protein